MSYLHEMAASRDREAQHERRRDEWAEVRADIDRALWAFHNGRTGEDIIIRAYHTGFKRGAAQAVPRPVAEGGDTYV